MSFRASASRRRGTDQDGVWYSFRARPYISTENKVEGAVLVLVNINQLKRTEKEIAEARDYAQAIVDTTRDPFLILDADCGSNRPIPPFTARSVSMRRSRWEG